MANTPDFHLKLIIGDLVLTVSRQAAEIETLRDALAKATTPQVKVSE